MSQELTRFDGWLSPQGPAALVLREPLMPVEGRDGVLFPPTYASGDGFAGGYNIDDLGDGQTVCLVDSVGSQSNRLEPVFRREGYRHLVPQVVVRAGEHRVNLLDAGHRAGDAIVRCSALQEELRAAFLEILRGNAAPLATIAPTSLVFGVWDSRDTQAKLPRLLASTVRAWGVSRLRRSAQFVPALDYVGTGALPEPADKKAGDAYAERGFNHVPATATHGGVIARGGVRRDASLHLAALRLLAAGEDAARTTALQRYLLGLALVAFTCPGENYLRQGCNLVADPESPRECVAVFPDGRREPLPLSHADAVAWAEVAARAFGVGEDREVDFDAERARRDLAGEGTTKGKKAKARGAQG